MLTSPMTPSQPDGLRDGTRSIPLAATGQRRAVYCMSAPGKEQRAPTTVLLRGPHFRSPQGQRCWARYRSPVPCRPALWRPEVGSREVDGLISLLRNGHLLVAATVQRRRTPPVPSRSFPRTGDRSLAADLSDLRFPARRSAIAGRGKKSLKWGGKVGHRRGDLR